MTKTEMALWLAGFIGWERGKDYSIGNEDIVPLIYSPKGFFAVLDAVEKKGYHIRLIPPTPHYEFYLCHLYEVNKRAFTTDPMIKEGYGKDRYEAFYNAVYEAMNAKINTNS